MDIKSDRAATDVANGRMWGHCSTIISPNQRPVKERENKGAREPAL